MMFTRHGVHDDLYHLYVCTKSVFIYFLLQLFFQCVKSVISIEMCESAVNAAKITLTSMVNICLDLLIK